ncbi:Histidine kinase [Leptospira interrogans serovar Canicola]|nr:Histidine kinase [Leptospira interrogans serovar Canicola]
MNDETRYYLRDLLILGLIILLSVVLAEAIQFSDQKTIPDDISFLDRIVVYIFFFYSTFFSFTSYFLFL